MAEYLARRIIDGALDYALVVSKKPQLKSEIDTCLIAAGRENLIVEA